jgi:hypothetical protein
MLFLTRRPKSERVNSNAIIEKGFIVCVVLKVNVALTVFVYPQHRVAFRLAQKKLGLTDKMITEYYIDALAWADSFE